MSNEVLLQTGNTPITFHVPNVNEMFKAKYKAKKPRKVIHANNYHTSIVIADTSGWDLTCAMRISDFNEAIKLHHSSPSNFKASFCDDCTGIKGEVEGTFGDWQIVRGGYGRFLRMSIPVIKCDAIIKEKHHKIDNLSVIAQINLSSILDIDKPTVKVICIKFQEGANVSKLVNSILMRTFEDWLSDNNREFANVLSLNSINLVFSKKWLKPTYTSFVYADGKDDSRSVFGTLCMTENRSPEGLQERLPTTTIPEGKRGLVMFGDHRIMKKSLLPKVSRVFKNAKKGALKMVNANTEISNTDDVIKLDVVTVNGVSYTPHVTLFNVRQENYEIKTFMRITTNISCGIDAFVDITTYQEMDFLHNPASKQIRLRETKDPEIKHGINVKAQVSMTLADKENIVAVLDAILAKYVRLLT